MVLSANAGTIIGLFAFTSWSQRKGGDRNGVLGMDGGTGLTGHAAIAVAGIAASAGLWLLGQADSVTLPDSVKDLGPVVLGSAAGAWFLRWFVTVYIPQVQQQHKDQIEKLATAHTTAMATVASAHEKTISSLVTEFRSETKDQRLSHADEIGRIMSIYRGDQPADASRPSNR